MAKREKKDKSKPKEIGKLRQLWRVFKMTAKVDKSAPWVALLAFVLPVLAGVGLGIIFDARNALVIFVWTLLGVMVGLLAGLAVMSRRAERAAYSQIQGQAGAVGAVLSSSLKRGWRTSEMPVAISPRSRDAVYRTVGPAGIVLIAEGSRAIRSPFAEAVSTANTPWPSVPNGPSPWLPDRSSGPRRRVCRAYAHSACSMRKASLSRPGVMLTLKVVSLGHPILFSPKASLT